MSGWLDIAALGSGSGALIGLVLHVYNSGVKMGGLVARVAAMERVLDGHNEVRELVAGLTSTVEALRESVDELKAAVHEIAPRTVRRSS